MHKIVKINLGPIQKALGDDHPMPELPAGPIGRFRLVETLRMRFGDNFKMMQGAKDALKHFDDETENAKFYAKMKDMIESKGEKK